MLHQKEDYTTYNHLHDNDAFMKTNDNNGEKKKRKKSCQYVPIDKYQLVFWVFMKL